MMADIIAQIKSELMKFGQNIGLIKKSSSSQPAPQKKDSAAAQTPSKKFDFNIFMKATDKFWKGFFTTAVPDFFKDPMPRFKGYGRWFTSLSNDEKAAHIIVYTGVLFIIFGIVFIIVL